MQPLAFSRKAVPPSTTVEIVARLQVLFRVNRLLVGSSIAEFFVIDDIKVGRNSQFVGTGGNRPKRSRTRPPETISRLDSCKEDVDITLIVTNIDGTAKDFRASLFGDAIE